jgi:transposase
MYSGIDLHSNNNVIAIIDDADRVVARTRLPNDVTKIVGFLELRCTKPPYARV